MLSRNILVATSEAGNPASPVVEYPVPLRKFLNPDILFPSLPPNNYRAKCQSVVPYPLAVPYGQWRLMLFVRLSCRQIVAEGFYIRHSCRNLPSMFLRSSSIRFSCGRCPLLHIAAYVGASLD